MDEAEFASMTRQKVAEIPWLEKRAALLQERIAAGDVQAAEELDFVSRKLSMARQARAALLSLPDAPS